MFNQLQFPADQIQSEVDRILASLAVSSPGAEPGSFASRVIADRLLRHPEAYLEFGPYWWAVKAMLRIAGADLGDADDALVRASYGGGLSAMGALAAGELFKEYYRRTYLVGAAQFWLDDGAEESYVLFDADMEARRVGKGGRRVSANLQSTELPNDPENAY